MKDYEAAGNFLRKEAECFCKEFLPKRYHYTNEYNLHNLNGLISQLSKFADGSGLELGLFDDLDSYRKFVLNPTSHDSYDVPKFNSEIDGCLNTLKSLREIKNENFLKRGEQIEFELTTADGIDTYKFEIRLEDDFRLLQEPTKDSVLSKGMINYWITKNGVRGDLKHGVENLKSFYDKNYEKSNKAKNADFWEEIVIQSTGEKLSSLRVF